MAIESGDLVRALLQKNKAVMSRLHAMIFPKADEEKSLEQLTDAFVVDTEATIEVFKRTSRTYDALLAFQLMMGYEFKADMEMMTKELSKDQDGQAIDMSLFKASARKCTLQLLGLVSANKSSTGKDGPSLSTQTQAS
jgi:tripartite-type tricarboxylate transporter receptor subunit TctC